MWAIISFLFTVAFAGYEGECRRRPTFSGSYSLSGSLYLPYTELLEPFHAWYDEPSEQSRIDYYGGMVKTYQFGKQGDFGSSMQIVPVTTETLKNVATCFGSEGAQEAPVTPQSLLPDTTNFTYVGTEVKNGYQCEIWRDIEVHYERQNTYTLWIRWQRNARSPSDSQPIPVRYEMKGYNSLIGSHYDHYYLDYDTFVIGRPTQDIFTISKDISCTNSEMLNDRHSYNFNPMKELVHRQSEHVDQAWDKFREDHSKSYSSDDHHQRKSVFTHNLRYIHSWNRKGAGFALKVNHLADRSDTELKALRGGFISADKGGAMAFPYNLSVLSTLAESVPQEFDWRIRGAVTPVKDQATCGSCWSFAAVGAMEGAYFLKTGKLVRFSEQALVDCTWGYGNNGCGGGSDTQSFKWIKKHGGIPTNKDYGNYLGQDGYCHTELVNLTASITEFINVKPNDETALRVALFKNGPVSVFIDASHRSFSFYSNGVYYEPLCQSSEEGLDHVVLVVGYGNLNGQDYWLVKNSWSNHWGDQGYVLMSTKDNNCGVMTLPSYVTM